MTADNPLRRTLLATLRPARSISPLIFGGALAASTVRDVFPNIREAIREGGDDERLFEYQRLFVRRMLSRYLAPLPFHPVSPELEEQRHLAAEILLPLIDYLHGLPSMPDSKGEFEALDRQWCFEKEWVTLGREGFPMMEAMLILEQVNRIV